MANDLSSRTTNLFNRPTPIKKQFQALGGGGKAQQASIGQKQKRLGDVSKSVTQQGLAKRSQAKQQLGQQASQFNLQKQEDFEVRRDAREQALTKFNNYIEDKKRAYAEAIDLLEKEKEEKRKQLQGILDEEGLEREMEGINQLISSASTAFMSAIPAIKASRAARKFREAAGPGFEQSFRGGLSPLGGPRFDIGEQLSSFKRPLPNIGLQQLTPDFEDFRTEGQLLEDYQKEIAGRKSFSEMIRNLGLDLGRRRPFPTGGSYARFF